MRGQLDDFHRRSRAIAEVEIRAGVEILQEIGINPNVFVLPGCSPIKSKIS
jgi:predicted deacetylase